MTRNLFVTSIFRSLQGESTYQGLPCTFIRLSECNLRCSYCDTKYSYGKGEEMSVEEIMQAVAEYPMDLVEITGGEPLLQMEGVIALCNLLIAQRTTVLIETNGSVAIDRLPKEVIKIMDFKSPSSGMCMHNLYSNIEHLSANDQVKFVLKTRQDFDWAVEVIKDNHLTHKAIVIFSCVADELKPSQLAEWILESQLPIRMQLQMHKYVWPDADKEV